MDADLNVRLGERCEGLAGAVQQAAAWVRDNRELVRGEHDGLLAELRRTGRFFRRCRTAATRKMCVGVFGPSQAGKSYLISALARDANDTLLADFSGETHDFVREINPIGGKESTGLVTRFTMTRPGPLPEGFPVQVRLLSETDLVKVFANTYYADCEHDDVPDAKAIEQELDALEKKVLPVGGKISLDDFEELQEYLLKNFKSKTRVQELLRSYWPRALEIGPRLGVKDRLRLYSLIWDKVEDFDKALEKLVTALEGLGHPEYAYCPLSALIPREKSIIDVAMLDGLGAPSMEDSITVVTLEGNRADLPRSVVTALTAELAIVMREKPDEYFTHTDLLDFPGYRARYNYQHVRMELKKEGTLKELFLRGKVAYLFQRYCTERELTSMLLCIAPGPQEVQDLPGVINDWVCSTHGETPQRRLGKPVSLFFVLTKCDEEFGEKMGDSSIEKRWDIRLEASLIQFFGRQHDWPNDWDGKRNFDNVFLLRNPNFIFDKVLEYNANRREIGIRPEKMPFVEQMRDSFFQSAAVASHFSDPHAAWDAVMTFNDGGIGLIRERLRPICNPELKRQQIESSLVERLERLVTRLSAYWKSDDKAEVRKQKDDLGTRLVRIFAEMIQHQRFGEFLCRLCIQDHDLHAMYYDAKRDMMRMEAEETAPHAPVPSVVGMTTAAGDILNDVLGIKLDPAPQAAESMDAASPAPPLDETASFASRIEGYWCQRLRELSDDPVLQQYFGLPQKEFGDFVGELIQGAARLGLRAGMEEAMRKAAAYADIDMERVVWKQSSLAAGSLNAFLDWLGCNPRLRSEAERTLLVRGRNVTVFSPPPPVAVSPHLSDELGVLEQKWYRDWLMALLACISANVDFDGKTTVNVEQNRILGDIIRVFAPQT
ncbi:type III effector HopL1 [Desulfovibrio sulfodismutans]|uniref:Type III effector HopL1 n=1 Tax=Desulfolutivibrio sulfodismutans TaxID=63561 RepID=A0A7K3NP02_9BACT|nr:virulence factor SrfC family protein [Desulfolutivibrio sulfodismutans]NDY56929.1 type III effector HopL1 [Desulfolutivibrio sulfodismutans]QLA12950.1 type III effector HopL1 [Desulfolutivibrio sulfodismutans DSM 3696]